MTVKECYEQMGADYEGVLGRLRSEALIKKFAKKFLDDGSFQSLKDNLAAGNGEEAFRAAHTLKGVCQNLGFDNLYTVSFDITEKLRERATEGSEELFAKVEEQYKKTCDPYDGGLIHELPERRYASLCDHRQALAEW